MKGIAANFKWPSTSCLSLGIGVGVREPFLHCRRGIGNCVVVIGNCVVLICLTIGIGIGVGVRGRQRVVNAVDAVGSDVVDIVCVSVWGPRALRGVDGRRFL